MRTPSLSVKDAKEGKGRQWPEENQRKARRAFHVVRIPGINRKETKAGGFANEKRTTEERDERRNGQACHRSFTALQAEDVLVSFELTVAVDISCCRGLILGAPYVSYAMVVWYWYGLGILRPP